MLWKSLFTIAAIIVAMAIAVGLSASVRDEEQLNSSAWQTGSANSDSVKIIIKTHSGWSANIKGSHWSDSHRVEGSRDRVIPITCDSGGKYSVEVQKSDGGSDMLSVEVTTEGHSSQKSTTTSANRVISLAGTC